MHEIKITKGEKFPMQKQKQKTIDDFPEHAQTSKRIHALQIEKLKVTEEKDQIITELLRPIPNARSAWDLASQGETVFPQALDTKAALRQKLAELEAKERFLDEAIVGGTSELASIRDRISFGFCVEERAEFIPDIEIILTSLRTIDEAVQRINDRRGNLEQRGFRTGSIPSCTFDLNGKWNDPFGGRVVAYQRYIAENFPELAEATDQPRQRKAS